MMLLTSNIIITFQGACGQGHLLHLIKLLHLLHLINLLHLSSVLQELWYLHYKNGGVDTWHAVSSGRFVHVFRQTRFSKHSKSDTHFASSTCPSQQALYDLDTEPAP